MKICVAFFISLLLLVVSSSSYASRHYTIKMLDEVRGRTIPVEIYEGETKTSLPIVIISHGYSVKNTEYSFIADVLAEIGYLVVSIQHDMTGDPALPKTDNIFERRKPMWQRGSQNIFYVISELKKERPGLNLNQAILIGHSNGGDISMMFANQYSETVFKIISLDSLRYPFPTGKKAPILYFAASDTEPDAGVVPSSGVETIVIEGVKHIDLCDRGLAVDKDKICQSIIRFLKL